jgi:dTDP-4-dehydrorhamnose reductase
VPRPRVLITGGSGLLALNWACAVRETHDVVLATHTRTVALAGARAMRLALDEPPTLEREVEKLAPNVVVHTAGITSVDECEREPERARHVYVELSRNVAQAAARAGARLVHISTDHLFAGTRSHYTETDTPEPINAYGRAKRDGEEAVAAACADALIVRTNFFGWGHRYRQSFSDWIYYTLEAGEEITMFDDVFITPTLADVVATSAHRLLDTGASGIWNIAGDERVSKYEFGVRLAEAFGLPATRVQRAKIAASQLSAQRPRDMSLSNTQARERLGVPLGTLADYFGVLREQDRAGRRRELLAAVTE